MSAFLRLLRYAAPYGSRLAAAVVAMVAYAAASVALARLIQPIFDEVLPGGGDLQRVALSLLVIYLVKGLGAYVSAYLMVDVGQRVVTDLRNELFGHVLGQSAGFFSRRSTGQLMSRLTHDVGQIQHAVSGTVGDLVRESLALVGYAGLLFYYDARLAVVCLTSAPLIVYPLVRLGQRVRQTTRRSQEHLESLSHRAAEAFQGHRIVKAFGAEGHELTRFSAAASRLYRTNMKVTGAVAALPPLMEFLGGLAMAGAIWYGAREISAGEMSTGQFTSFIAALFLMYGPAKKLSRVNATLQQAMAAAERIFELIDTHTEVRDRPGAGDLAPFRREIEFRHVSFRYGEERGTILRDVSFSVRAGQLVAIVGLSGAGKTTLVNLIPRFYDPAEGAVLIDGVDIRDVTLRSLRANVGLVTQDIVLFDDSIAANIAYGVPGASQEAIERAARSAHAHEFIMELTDGYETMIGERGQRLSGGQRQRVAIARALLKDSPVLILDEATSSLDAESERLVQEALAELLRNRTALVIAHRLSTVRRADAIIVLEDGEVKEIGRHDELLARADGLYGRLYALQMFEPPPAGPRRAERLRATR